MHNINWDDLRILLMVADTGSQSAAAERSGVNQTTISRRLRQLEKDYGQPLLHRQKKGYDFTCEARLLIEQARKMESHMLEIARARANDQRSELEGQVVVSSTDMVLRYMIAPLLSEFRQRHPGIELVLLSNDEVVSLSHMEADIALRYVRSEQQDIVQRKLITFQYRYFASPEYLDKYPVDESQPLQGHQMLKFDHRKYRYNPQQLEDFSNNHIVLRSNHVDTLIDACKQGLGVMSIQQQYGVQIPGIRMLSIPPHREVSVWVASHKDNSHLPAIRAVKAFIVEAGERCGRGEFAVKP